MGPMKCCLFRYFLNVIWTFLHLFVNIVLIYLFRLKIRHLPLLFRRFALGLTPCWIFVGLKTLLGLLVPPWQRTRFLRVNHLSSSCSAAIGVPPQRLLISTFVHRKLLSVLCLLNRLI